MSSKTAIYVAIELSASSWLLAARLPGIKKARVDGLESGDTRGLLKILADLRSQGSTKLGMTADLACCFEAGRDGFWLHRWLTVNGGPVARLETHRILCTL